MEQYGIHFIIPTFYNKQENNLWVKAEDFSILWNECCNMQIKARLNAYMRILS